ncbi:MAG TPA: HEAT repeat domain-containing protein, partial [Myxococcaceae bacterium]|nr:HEAT repeat domain-containing protein [Myxococcaceae bacterium]
MLPSTARFYNPDGPLHVAVLSVEETLNAGEYLIHLSRGKSALQLPLENTYGPYPREEVPGYLAELAGFLRGEGFWRAGLHELLADVQSEDPAKRARAALRLGWRREIEAVDALLGLLPNAVDEVCAVVDALGMIGDPRAIPHLRPVAQRKLLSRRRSGAEALRNLGDQEGLTTVRQLALERLPESVRAPAAAEPGDADKLTQAVLSLEIKDQGPALDTLYELATPASVVAVRAILAKVNFAQAHLWRATKSIFKRSLLRCDYVMMGWLNHAVEARGRTTGGTSATVKSGYDGAQRHTPIFQKWTQQFMRRLTWRYLRDVARYRPDEYAHAAAEVVIHFGPEDGDEYAYWGPRYGGCFALHQILYGASKRFEQSGRKPRFHYRHGLFGPKGKKAPPPEVHEEAYPHLWDAQPRAFLRLLSAARLPEAHAFATRAVQTTHRTLVETATVAEVVGMLSAPYEPTVQLGLAELERRFDPHNPDEEILNQLLRDERPMVRELGQKWLHQTLPFWIG